MLHCFPDPWESSKIASLGAPCCDLLRKSVIVHLGICGELRTDSGEFLDCKAMGTDPINAPQCDAHRYEAVVRISEAIAACREPEQLATTPRLRLAVSALRPPLLRCVEGELQGNRISRLG